jgi:hypothetical protein
MTEPALIEIIDQLNQMGKNTLSIDNEELHIQADNLLCQALRQLGHANVVDNNYKVSAKREPYNCVNPADVADAYESARNRCGFWYA